MSHHNRLMDQRKKLKKQGPQTLAQFRRQRENDYDYHPWTQPIFSYGVNTNIEQVKERCPDWDGRWAPCMVRNWRMTFNKQYPSSPHTYCNIEPAKGDYVLGCLLWLDPKSFKALDRFEGYPVHYRRQKVVTLSMSKAWAYVSDHKGDGAPTAEYFEAVIAGLKQCGAHDEYIKKVIADAEQRFERQEAQADALLSEPEYLPAKYRMRPEVAMW